VPESDLPRGAIADELDALRKFSAEYGHNAALIRAGHEIARLRHALREANERIEAMELVRG
jgi:hypothetical protein